MPTYEYACRSCGSQIEVVQSFSDAALTTCGECGGDLRKVFSPVGIAFKGSGFYKTDSRSGSSSRTSSSSSSSSESSTTASKPSTESSPKPASTDSSSSPSTSTAPAAAPSS